jgi:CubicO group peptidase (beta-lactamase class C family)
MQRLPASVAEFARAEMARLQVPGVAVGISMDGQHFAGGLGVTNVDHPLQVTPDTLFQIGSTSKTFTATVAMMLADAGRLEIDAPVRRHLPTFTTRSEQQSARVTIEHLLTHHTGWPGDYFKDFGRGDYTNRPARRFKEKPGAVNLWLGLWIRIRGRMWRWKLRRYRQLAT